MRRIGLALILIVGLVAVGAPKEPQKVNPA
jgi:hypothetical protein